MGAMRYAQLVQPEHPGVGTLAEALMPSGPAGTPPALPEVLSLLTSFHYINTRKHTPLDQVLESGVGNCLSLCVLLASVLRRVGYPSEAVYIAVGGRRQQWLAGVHAWVALPLGTAPGVLLIDPSGFVVTELSLAELLDNYSFALVFNDIDQLSTQDEQQALFGLLANQSVGGHPHVERA